MGAGNDIFRSTLKIELEEAGLPSNPSEVIGRLYRFVCEHGSHHHVLVGVVQAIELSDEGGLDLYVTNPRFWGEQLISIKHSNGKWSVRVHAPALSANRFEGKFELL